jgi:hypothetical protein
VQLPALFSQKRSGGKWEIMYIRKLIIGGAAVLVSCSVYGAHQEPIYVADQNPFTQIYGLPKPEAGFITPKRKLDVGFLYHVSNGSISSESSSGEAIVWDQETALYNLRFRYGLLERLELGIDIPFVQHSGGYLDSTVRHFHDLFSFPNDRQVEFEKNEIQSKVTENGVSVYEMDEDTSGIGDVRVSAAVPLAGMRTDSKRFLALRSLVKLPTGDADYLLGSGGTDVAVGLSFSDMRTLQALRMGLTLYGGAMYLGESDVLSNRQEHFAGYGGGSLGWRVFSWLDLKVQLDLHSALYDSDLDQLGSSMQLVGGGTILFPYNIVVDLGMTQNTFTDATPDVGFYLFLKSRF